MSKFVKLKKGFDIRLVGRADKKIAPVAPSETYVLKPTDFVGLQSPKLLVHEGDKVKAGTPLLFDRKSEEVLYTSPVSGEVIEINRGEKRKLLSVKILADKTIEYIEFSKYSQTDIDNLSREDIVNTLLKSGAWINIIQRPYGIVADAQDTPKSIFISTFDTHPLAPDYEFLLKGQEQFFQTGINILKKLTSGIVHLGVDAHAEASSFFNNVKNVQINKISGPHPAGNVGVQIHHIDPINKGDVVWTLNPWAVAHIGKLFSEGKYDVSKVIALVGSEIKNPQYYQVISGTSISKLVEQNLKSDNVRFISGNVLTGERIERDGYIGHYDNMVTVIPEGNYYEMLGWIKPTTRLSFHRAFGLLSFLNPKKEYVLDTNTRGEERAFVMTGAFERVLPMDIYPTHLLKAILAQDYDDMEALGIYEVIEEDLALCEFIDVSKHDVQAILRDGLTLIKEG